MKWITCSLIGARAHAWPAARAVCLLRQAACSRSLAEALRLEADVDHRRAHQLDGLRVGGVEEQHRRRVAGAEALLPHLAQQVAHVHRHVAEVDRSPGTATGTCGTPCSGRPRPRTPPSAGWLMPRRVCSSYRKASISSEVARILLRGLYSRLARGTCVAQTGLHLPQRRQSLMLIGDRADVALLHDQRLVAHQAEARRVGVAQVGAHARRRWPRNAAACPC